MTFFDSLYTHFMLQQHIFFSSTLSSYWCSCAYVDAVAQVLCRYKEIQINNNYRRIAYIATSSGIVWSPGAILLTWNCWSCWLTSSSCMLTVMVGTMKEKGAMTKNLWLMPRQPSETVSMTSPSVTQPANVDAVSNAVASRHCSHSLTWQDDILNTREGKVTSTSKTLYHKLLWWSSFYCQPSLKNETFNGL